MSFIMGFCQRLIQDVERHMQRPDDSVNDVHRKVTLFFFITACALANALLAYWFPMTVIVIGGVMLLQALSLWFSRELSNVALNAHVVLTIAFISYWDAVGAAEGIRSWPLFVILADVLLFVNAPRPLLHGLVIWVVIWAGVVAFEDDTRLLGLYDLPETMSYKDRRGMCTCEKPPCPSGSRYIQTMLCAIFVFVVDFTLTRFFAYGVQREKNLMAASIDVAGRIARHLAAYDLDAAEACLEGGATQLPHELAVEFSTIVANLRSYRAFLPDALFLSQRGTREGTESFDVSEPSLPDSVQSDLTLYVHDAELLADVGLKPARVTLLKVAFPHGDAANTGAFVTGHTASLEAVISVVKDELGSLLRFDGDCVLASFNAFSQVTNQCAHALNALVKVRKVLAGASASAVTGKALAGYLGTQALRSPVVVGDLPHILSWVLRGAMAVGEAAVCCSATAPDNKTLLRLLLHDFLYGEKYVKDGSFQMYALELTGPTPTDDGTGNQLLGIDEAGGWEEYNNAASVYHKKGRAMSIDYLASIEASDVLVKRFQADSAAARRVYLSLRLESPLVPPISPGRSVGTR